MICTAPAFFSIFDIYTSNMSSTSIYEQFLLSGPDVVLSYKGEINEDLLESIYASMDRHFDEDTSEKQKKRFFQVLVEALQNVFHHQSDTDVAGLITTDQNGFVILDHGHEFQLITGNYLKNSSIPAIRSRIDEVNGLTPDELRKYHQKALAESELSEKGGAGLGIIEMVRRSGNPLSYEFKKINDTISFFCLSAILPKK